MPWLIVSPWHQQRWYWICRMQRSGFFVYQEWSPSPVPSWCWEIIERANEFYVYFEKLSAQGLVTLHSGRNWYSLCFFSLSPGEYVYLQYNDVIMSAMPSQISSLIFVYSTVYSGAYQRKHQSFASLAFVRGIHRWPVNSLHKRPVTRKILLLGMVIATLLYADCITQHTSISFIFLIIWRTLISF